MKCIVIPSIGIPLLANQDLTPMLWYTVINGTEINGSLINKIFTKIACLVTLISIIIRKTYFD